MSHAMISVAGTINRNLEQFAVVTEAGEVLQIDAAIYGMQENTILLKAKPIDPERKFACSYAMPENPKIQDQPLAYRFLMQEPDIDVCGR